MPSQAELRPDQDKALVVIDFLLAAAIQPPFGFDRALAGEEWGIELGSFPIEVCLDAARHWTTADGASFPQLGQFLARCRIVQRSHPRDSQPDYRQPALGESPVATKEQSLAMVRDLKERYLRRPQEPAT